MGEPHASCNAEPDWRYPFVSRGLHSGAVEREADMSSITACEAELVELAGDDAAELFDDVARHHLGISGDEFLRRLDAGEWNDVDMDAVPGLIDVWMALPFVR